MKLITRIIPLLTALWLNVDICLDVNQGVTYYKEKIDSNGSYHCPTSRSVTYINELNDTCLQSISPTYFYAASTIWILPPLLAGSSMLWVIAFGYDGKYFVSSETQFKYEWLKRLQIKPSRGKNFRAFICLTSWPFCFVCGILHCYILLPIIATAYGVDKLRHGDNLDEDKKFLSLHYRQLPENKLFECFGEAIPQLILGIIYIANHYQYLRQTDDHLNIGIPMSIISAIFSLGSVLIGVVAGGNSVNWSLSEFYTLP